MIMLHMMGGVIKELEKISSMYLSTYTDRERQSTTY